MKRWILLSLALLCCAVPASAGGFSLFATYITTDATDEEVGLGLKAEFNAGRQVDFQIRAAVYEDLETDPDPNVYDIQAVPIDFGINWDFADEAKVNPYLGLGITYWVLDFSNDVTTSPGPPRGMDIDPEIGYYVEGGVEFDVHRAWSIFIEGVYRDAKAEAEGDDLGLPIDQEVDLTGGAANVGVTLRW